MTNELFYQGNTGELTIYSTVTGEVLLNMTTMDIPLIHEINKAFRRAEKLAAIGAARSAGAKVLQLAKEMEIQ
jgi:hypothetical protein